MGVGKWRTMGVVCLAVGFFQNFSKTKPATRRSVWRYGAKMMANSALSPQ